MVVGEKERKDRNDACENEEEREEDQRYAHVSFRSEHRAALPSSLRRLRGSSISSRCCSQLHCIYLPKPSTIPSRESCFVLCSIRLIVNTGTQPFIWFFPATRIPSSSSISAQEAERAAGSFLSPTKFSPHTCLLLLVFTVIRNMLTRESHDHLRY